MNATGTHPSVITTAATVKNKPTKLPRGFVNPGTGPKIHQETELTWKRRVNGTCCVQIAPESSRCNATTTRVPEPHRKKLVDLILHEPHEAIHTVWIGTESADRHTNMRGKGEPCNLL